MTPDVSQDRAFLVTAQGDLAGVLVIECALLLGYRADSGDDISFEATELVPILAAPIGIDQLILGELLGKAATPPTKPTPPTHPFYRVRATSDWDQIDAFLRRVFTERAIVVTPKEDDKKRPQHVQEEIEFYVRTIIVEIAKGEIAIDERRQKWEEHRQQQETAAADGYRGVRVTPVDWGPFGADGPTI